MRLVCYWSPWLVFITLSRPNIHPHKCAPSGTILRDDKARLLSSYLISAVKVSTWSSVRVLTQNHRERETVCSRLHQSRSNKHSDYSQFSFMVRLLKQNDSRPPPLHNAVSVLEKGLNAVYHSAATQTTIIMVSETLQLWENRVRRNLLEYFLHMRLA